MRLIPVSARHSLTDLLLAVLLVVAHAFYGSLNSLADPITRLTFNAQNGYVAYLLLSVWVGSIVAQETIQFSKAVSKQYKKLFEETANPSVLRTGI